MLILLLYACRHKRKPFRRRKVSVVWRRAVEATALEVYLNELAGEISELCVTSEVNINDIRIYNLLGQTLMNKKNVNSPKINISNLSEGVYIAEITTQNGVNKTLKFNK